MIKIFEVGLKDMTKPWDIDSLKYGNFIGKEGFQQQILVYSGVHVKSIDTEMKEVTDKLSVRVTTITFDEHVRFYPSPHTLNVSVQKCGNIEDKREEFEEVLFLFIMNREYPMLRYKTDYDIVNTFHHTKEGAEETYYGCMMIIPSKDYFSDKDPILTLQMKDNNDFRYFSVVNGDIQSSIIRNPKVVEGLNSGWKKRKGKSLFFQVTPIGLRTTLLIGRDKDLPDYVIDEISEKWTHSKNSERLEVFLLPDNVNPEAPAKAYLNKLQNIITGRPKIRAVTIYEDAVQPAALLELKFLYVFTMDHTGTVKTIKSN